jgi:hypothetical protein
VIFSQRIRNFASDRARERHARLLRIARIDHGKASLA